MRDAPASYGGRPVPLIRRVLVLDRLVLVHVSMRVEQGRRRACSMSVVVVLVRGVVMVVLDGFVSVHVGMCAEHGWVVRVGVVPVVMTMLVLVIERLVAVSMAVAFADVEVDAEREQPSRGEREGAGVAIAETPAQRGPDERREREDGARTTRPDATLRE